MTAHNHADEQPSTLRRCSALASRHPYHPLPFPVISAKKIERGNTRWHKRINYDGNGSAFPTASAEQAFRKIVDLNMPSNLGPFRPWRGEFRRGFPDFSSAAAPNAQQGTLPRAIRQGPKALIRHSRVTKDRARPAPARQR